MKKTMMIGVLVVFLALPVAAKTLYVKDGSSVNLRAGNGTRHPVIATIDPGRPLERLETSGNWTKVRLTDETQGWMVSRLLTDKKPVDAIVTDLNAQIRQMSVAYEALQSENERLIIESQALQEKLEKVLEQLAQTEAAHATLINESGDFLTLKADHERISDQLAEKTETIASLETELKKTNRSCMIYWFLAGAGVLLLGMIIGAAMKRKRTKFI